MSKTLNLNEASSWDQEELLNNIKYLEDRGRYNDAAPLREQAGLDPVDTSGNANPDIDLLLNDEQLVTSRFGTNDTPEYDPETDPKTKVKVGRTRDMSGDVGPHGANADQFDPKDEERQTKNRPAGSDGTRKKSSKKSSSKTSSSDE